jgi:PhzF family phenazine biosynthesis protein
MHHRFHQLDVFTATPLKGNPLAVVHDAQGLSDATMAAFARWTNLSETTFLLPPEDPGADYRVRIFTPGGELPFAGHPTLGSCAAWLAAGGRPKAGEMVMQECGVGRVRIRRDGSRLAFAAPPLRRTGPLDADLVAHIASGLGVPKGDIHHHQWVDNGPGWCAVMLPSASQVRALKPDFAALADVKLGVIGPCERPQDWAAPSPPPEGVKKTWGGPAFSCEPGEDTAFEVRAFVPGLGVPEDPVTGSLNAGLAQWLIGAGLAPQRYVVAQGSALGRAGRVHVLREGEDVWIGGDVAMCIEGEVTL